MVLLHLLATLASKPERGNSVTNENPNGASTRSSGRSTERTTTAAPRAQVVKPKAVATPKAVPTPSLSPAKGKSDANKNRVVEEIVP